MLWVGVISISVPHPPWHLFSCCDVFSVVNLWLEYQLEKLALLTDFELIHTFTYIWIIIRPGWLWFGCLFQTVVQEVKWVVHWTQGLVVWVLPVWKCEREKKIAKCCGALRLLCPPFISSWNIPSSAASPLHNTCHDCVYAVVADRDGSKCN